MQQDVPVEVLLTTIQECQRNLEKFERVLNVVAPNDMDQFDALKDLRMRCADSLYTINKANRLTQALFASLSKPEDPCTSIEDAIARVGALKDQVVQLAGAGG